MKVVLFCGLKYQSAIGLFLSFVDISFYKKITALFVGTAGVWRISAINDAGGWNDRTTVEDMDLAVRAALHGWKFIYVGDIKVMNLCYLKPEQLDV